MDVREGKFRLKKNRKPEVYWCIPRATKKEQAACNGLFLSNLLHVQFLFLLAIIPFSWCSIPCLLQTHISTLWKERNSKQGNLLLSSQTCLFWSLREKPSISFNMMETLTLNEFIKPSLSSRDRHIHRLYSNIWNCLWWKLRTLEQLYSSILEF